MHSIRNKKIILICIATIVILIGQLAEIRNSSLLLFFALSLAAIYGMFCDISLLVGLVLMFIAPNRLLTFGPISAPAIVMLVGVIRLSWNGKLHVRLNAIIWSVLMIILSIMTCFNGRSQIIGTFKIFVVLYFIKIYFANDRIDKHYIELVESCSLGCIISSLLTLALNPSALYENVRFSLTGTGGENVHGILCAVMFLNNLNIILYKDDRRRGIHIIGSVGLALICLLTGSRSGVICVAAGLFGFFIFSCLRLRLKQAFILLLFSGVAAIIAYSLMQGNNIIADYVQRFIYRTQKLSSGDISNGRFDIWKMYISALKANPLVLLFGGMDSTSYGIYTVAHNMIIEQIAGYGIIGSLIITLLYIETYRDLAYASKSIIRFSSTGIIPIIAFLIISMFSHTLIGISQTMMLFISACGILEANK